MSPRDDKQRVPTILVVEDSPTQAEYLHHILGQSGYLAAVVHDGQEALAALKTQPPDLVISDIMMPLMDGFELCRAIKSDEGLKHIPVILLTTLSDPADVLKGLECGADNFLTKPVQPQHLLERIRELFVDNDFSRDDQGSSCLDISFAGKKYSISAERRQILGLLLSSYGAAFQKNQELIKAQNELRDLNNRLEQKVGERTKSLEVEIAERKLAEAEIQRNYEAQTVISSLLHHSLEDIPLEDLLKKALAEILTLRIISLDGKGCIFLVPEGRPELVMSVEVGLSAAIKTSCARVPFGKCVCGQAAATRKIQFREQGHEPEVAMDTGTPPHGNYCVPITTAGKMLGVLNLYLKEGHSPDHSDEMFLSAIADTLAGIMIRKQTEAEKEKIQAQFIRSQKMEAIGRLAGGVAHDFNNLLTVIMGNTSLLLYTLDPTDKTAKKLEVIQLTCERAAQLTRQLLAFSRRQVLEPAVVDLNNLIEMMSKMFPRLVGEDINNLYELAPRLRSIKADPSQIEQVILNLVVNARDAMPKGGSLRISTENVLLDENSHELSAALAPGNYILLCVADNGEGMSEETTEKVFEPFFTTKGSGTGLGLSTVFGIIKQLGGYIQIVSAVGAGTTFRIYIPAHGDGTGAGPCPEMPQKKTMLAGKETILLIEDDSHICELTTDILSSLGYTVISALDRENGLLKAREHDNIDLLLSDIVLPDGRGGEIAEKLWELRPGLKALFISGYADDSVVTELVSKGKAHFMRKPFSLLEITGKIREVLDE